MPIACFQVHLSNSAHKFIQGLITILNTRPQFLAIHIEVVKKTREVSFTLRILCRFLNRLKNFLQSLIQVLIGASLRVHILKKLTGVKEETTLFHNLLNYIKVDLQVIYLRVVEAFGTCFLFLVRDVLREIFRNKPVEHHAQYILFKVPAIYRPTKIIGNTPNSTVQLCTFIRRY